MNGVIECPPEVFRLSYKALSPDMTFIFAHNPLP